MLACLHTVYRGFIWSHQKLVATQLPLSWGRDTGDGVCSRNATGQGDKVLGPRMTIRMLLRCVKLSENTQGPKAAKDMNPCAGPSGKDTRGKALGSELEVWGGSDLKVWMEMDLVGA